MIPLWLKIVYTLFMAVLVPYYWIHYTPVNFLWFCDVALFLTLAALWSENALLASMPAVAITLPQFLWVADFVVVLATGTSPIGLSDYMDDAGIPWYVRGLSLFHAWLPFLLLWLVWRLGYDRRALVAQTMLCIVVLALSYWLTNGPDGLAGNVNKVYGPDDLQPQTLMKAWQWVGVLMLAYPLLIYLPTHLLLRWLAPAVTVETRATAPNPGEPRLP